MFYPFSVCRIPDRQSTTYWIDGVTEYAPLSSSVVISDDECNHNWLVVMERRCMSRVSFERADNRDGSDLGWGSFWGSNPQAQACAACREIALTGCWRTRATGPVIIWSGFATPLGVVSSTMRVTRMLVIGRSERVITVFPTATSIG